VPRRTLWLVTGAVAGAASSLYAERKLRRTVEAASARLQPDALVGEVGRTARRAARSTGGRVRDALATGRTAMQRHEAELWADLAASGAVPPPDDRPGTVGRDASDPPTSTPPASDPTASDPSGPGPDGGATSVTSHGTAPGPTPAHPARRRGLRRTRRSSSHLGK